MKGGGNGGKKGPSASKEDARAVEKHVEDGLAPLARDTGMSKPVGKLNDEVYRPWGHKFKPKLTCQQRCWEQYRRL